ncbi:MAG: hypothetical protein KF838_13440 [Phycisphaeraceae bacterium]|nr:MAG: hypothetical protein KF838_13440 [Phycisphaeraceae bacterium]
MTRPRPASSSFPPPSSTPPRAGSIWLALLAALIAAPFAQAGNPADPPRAPSPELAAAHALGQRAEATLNAAHIHPTIVIVPDVWSYIEAVARWTPTLRYPVLIDDGTPDAADNIARFVAAFAPTTVLRWASDIEPARGPSLTSARVDRAVALAWGASPDDAPVGVGPLLSMWTERAHEPTGVIVANPADAAWTGALAIAAARGQPIMWTELGRNPNASLTLDEAKELASRIEAFCTANGLRWARLGDTIDAVTLCANAPIKLIFAEAPARGPAPNTDPKAPPERQMLALTDFIGRHLPGRAAEGRWAWAGQIMGDAHHAAYRAMAALFLRPDSAWIFDSYTEPGVWQEHDGAAAARELERAGWTVRLDDAPNATSIHWRTIASRPIDPGLVLITTMGNANFFELGRQDRCAPGDLPTLRRPAMLHFVHSWSLTSPAATHTVGARWLDRGVYAYAGSVQEPFLAAFVPTPDVARRLASGIPWGAAIRVEAAPVWRIASLGDPLITTGPARPPERSDAPLPLEGAADLESAIKDALRNREMEPAIRSMALLGRHEDIARLVRALLADAPETLTPAIAALAAPSAFHLSDLDLLLRLRDGMSQADAARPRILDPLWNLARSRIHSMDDPSRRRVLDALRTAVRADQPGADGIELTHWLRRYATRAEAEAFAHTIRPLLRQPRDQRALDAALTGRDLSGRE